ncbi:DUF3806 domain-containing protein [Noviherbaspirillum massiliense]|uniref:DUF3806 domain-containing protein n=1 Tax=Noviherbaspirillum massiliense TaxID=1465823 RepID=UPI0002F463B9|nr:DUF3806 domain-containing protein [Noviherbaspirillum massiliense]
MAEVPSIFSLAGEDRAQLDKQRAVVEHYLADEESRKRYQTAAGKLGTLRALLEARVFKPEQSYELQCMGVVPGDAFVQDMVFEWVIVEDEQGRDPAIRYRDTSIILYPFTMISKRIERGDEVDIFDLYNGIAGRVEEMAANGF